MEPPFTQAHPGSTLLHALGEREKGRLRGEEGGSFRAGHPEARRQLACGWGFPEDLRGGAPERTPGRGLPGISATDERPTARNHLRDAQIPTGRLLGAQIIDLIHGRRPHLKKALKSRGICQASPEPRPKSVWCGVCGV